MTNPGNAIGTNAAYSGRTSANAFNDVLSVLSRGIVSGWACSPDTGMSVVLGGDGTTRDVAIAEDNIGNRTTINNISGAPVGVTIGTAPLSNSRIDLIVAYVDNPPEGTSTITDNYEACGLIVVQGTASASPTAPDDSDIRTAITSDGGSGVTAYYVVLAEIAVASGTTVIDGSLITQGGNAGIANQNIQDGTIISSKFAQYAVNSATKTANNLTPSADTPAAWATLFGGDGYFWTYYSSNCFTNQPSQYGQLETLITGSQIYQRWHTHVSGPEYYRGGNGTGWYGISGGSGAFRQVIDTHVDTGTFSMKTGFASGGFSFIKKIGNLVTLQLQFTSTSVMSADTPYTICTIPNELKPSQTTMGFGSTTTGAHYITCFVNTDGTISARPSANISTTTSRYVCASYLLG